MNPAQMVSQYVGGCAPFVYLFPYSQNSDPPYMPCSVDWYLSQVELFEVSGGVYQPPIGPPVTENQLPANTNPGEPLPYLQIPDPTATSPVRLGDLSTAVAYVHIRQVAENSPLFDLQYWLYYAVRGRSTYRLVGPYLDFNADLLAPLDAPYQGPGEHQGDWKHVTVRINLQGQVQAVFYAQHSGGFWCLPGQYQTTPSGNPIVYSARNTHSCFPTAGRFNQMGSFRGVMGYGVSLLEWTATGGETWDCSQNFQLVDFSAPEWLAFIGQWGPPLQETVDPSSFALLPKILNSTTLAQIIETQIAEIAQGFIPNPETGADNPPQQGPWQQGDGDPPPPGWQPWSKIQPTTQAKAGAAVTAVWRDDGSLDLFMTDGHGVVQWTWTDETLTFGQAWTPIQVNKVNANPGGAVTALWRDEEHIDLFMTGTDGKVWWTWGTLDGISIDWSQQWVPIQDNTRAQAGATVTATWSTGNLLNLFMTGTDGTVWWVWTDLSMSWQQTWTAIQRGKRAQPRATVTALWRGAGDAIDLFMTGQDGTVYWTLGSTDGGPINWPQLWTSIQSSSAKAQPGAAVTAAWRDPEHLDLFMTGTDGRVWWTTGFLDEVGDLSWPFNWTSIQDSKKANIGATVTALWQDYQQLNLFMSGTDGTIYTISTPPSMSWDQDWASIQPSVAKSQPGAPVTALWNDPDRIDIFMTGTDGVIWHSWLPVE